jgi:drug/metabolite transporter (DMT)-like permease
MMRAMDWLPLSLLSAFSLASADALTKKLLSSYTARELVMVRFGFPALLLAPLLLFEPLPSVPAAFWGWVAGLVPLEVLAMLLYVRAICDSPLALTLPYLALTPVFTTVTGLLVLGERVSVTGFGGVALVVAGAYLLNLERLSSGSPGAWLAPFRAILSERGSRLMVIVASIYSLTSVMGKGALLYMPPRSFGPLYFAILGPLTVAVFSVQQPGAIRALWRRPISNLLVGLCLSVMVLAHFMAIAQVEVAYMIAVKRTSLLFGILYGALLFGEERLGQHLAAGALMIAGVVLITW